MKISKYLALGFLVISLTPVFGQPTPPVPISAPQHTPFGRPPTFGTQTETPELTKFNLDFPGGTPAQLVKAIEKAMGKPLNVIIPDEDADLQMPPLKMNDVVVPQLFKALEAASVKPVKVVTGSYFTGSGNQESYSIYTSDYGFKTDGQPADSSIWYFHADKPPLPAAVLPQKVCKFYPLAEYLNRGLTVDDITTAIQTGWKMAEINSLPELNYHKETKLLIAFGEPNELKTIDDVLKALEPPKPPTFQELSDQNAAEQLKRAMQFQEEELKTSTNSSPKEKSGK